MAAKPEQKAFLDAINGDNFQPHQLALACEWYTSFLKSKIAEAWTPLFRPILIGICSDCEPCESCLEVAFTFLKIVVSVFPRKNLALVEIVDELYNNQLLKAAEDDDDHDESNANQLAFAAFGWISELNP